MTLPHRRGHLLADYAANGSALIAHLRDRRICGYRCVSNAIARRRDLLMSLLYHRWNRHSAGASSSMYPLHWCFHGPVVALFPGSIHSPRHKAGLLVCDIKILRMHYAETLKAWRERFMARREEAVRLYDERFARMWEFYLAASEMSFRKQNLMNFQIQLTRRQEIVPMTRNYIAREEARLRRVEF